MNNADLLSAPLTSLSVCVNWWWALVLSREGKPVVGHLCDTSISPYHPFTLSICPCPSLFLSISLSPAVTHFSNLHFQTSHPLHKVITHQLLKQCVWMYVCLSACMLAHHKRLVTFFGVPSLRHHQHWRVCWLRLSVCHLLPFPFRSLSHTLNHLQASTKLVYMQQNLLCQPVYIRSEADWKNAHALCPHTQTEDRCLLPALWLINFPDQACPTIKCSPPFWCHTPSVPPLSCVSLLSLAHFTSPGLWLNKLKMSRQRTSLCRTSASLIFSLPSFFHLHISLSGLGKHLRTFPHLNLSAYFLYFFYVLTAFILLILSSQQAKVTVPPLSLFVTVCTHLKIFIWYVVYCIRFDTLLDPIQFG